MKRYLNTEDLYLTFLEPKGAMYDMAYPYDDDEDMSDCRYGLTEREIRERMNRALRDDEDEDELEMDFGDLDDEDNEDNEGWGWDGSEDE